MTRTIPPAAAPATARRLLRAATTGLSLAAGAACAWIEHTIPPAGTLSLLGMGAILLVALSVADFRTHKIPDRILVSLSALVIGWVAGGSLLAADVAPADLGDAAIGAAVLAAVYFVLGLLGMVGFGDVKLAGVLGLWVGSLGGVAWMLIPLVAIAISGMQQLCLRALRRPSAVAHGPALALAGAASAVIAFAT